MWISSARIIQSSSCVQCNDVYCVDYIDDARVRLHDNKFENLRAVVENVCLWNGKLQNNGGYHITIDKMVIATFYT